MKLRAAAERSRAGPDPFDRRTVPTPRGALVPSVTAWVVVPLVAAAHPM
jgi:hypothetical protein